jgi:hypothetical protein
MARVMRRALVGPLTVGGFTQLLAPPVGKKYEVLHVSFAEYSGLAVAWRLAENFLMLAEVYLDELSVVAGKLVDQRSYQSMLIPAGSSLDVGTVSPGSAIGFAVVTYMDVDL